MSKVLLLADLQLRNFVEFSSINEFGYNSRLFNLLEGLSSHVIQEKPDMVVLAGDIFENKSTLEVDMLHLVHSVFQIWTQWTKKVAILLGNHDTSYVSQEINSLAQFAPFCRVIVAPEIYEGIAFSPWRATTDQIENDIKELSKSKVPILVGHWTVRGALTGGTTLTTGVDPALPALRRFQHVLLGDIHLSQQIGENILYLGSPHQNNFGEENNPTQIWLLDTDTDELRAIPTNFPRFKTCSTVEEAEEARKAGHYVRVKAKSREEVAKGVEAGIRTEQDFVEQVAEGLRGQVNNVEEAISFYAFSNNREDLADVGLKFLEGATGHRTIPALKLNFEKLHAENFLAYQNLDIDFADQAGLVIVNGKVIDDNTSYTSNGSGKTSLFECLYYALYGVTLRFGIRRDATIREGEKNNVVILDVSLIYPDGGHIDKIRIHRPRPGVVHLTLNGQDITNSDANLTQKRIIELVGEPSFFLRSALLALHAHPSFLKLSDPDKKKFIDEFSGLDCFTKARELVASAVSKLELDAHRQEVEETRLGERRTLTEAHLESSNSERATFLEREHKLAGERKAEIEELEAEKKALILPVKPQEPNFVPPEMVEPTMPETENPTPIKERVDANEALLAEVKPLFETLLKEHYQRQEPLKEKVTLAKNRLETLRRSTESDKCPTCNRPFEDIVKRNKHLQVEIEKATACWRADDKELMALQTKLTEEADGYRREILELEKKIGMDRHNLEFINGLRFQYERAMNVYNRIFQQAEIAHKDKIAELQRQYDAAQHVYSLHQQRINERIFSLKSILPAQPTQIEERIAQLKDQIIAIGFEEADLRNKKERLLTEKANLEFWLTGFGNRGCKSLLYTSLIDKLNEELAQISNIITGGALSLRMLPYSETAKGTQVEKISLEVTNYMGSSSYDGDSLGEQTRIDIAVNMALRRVLRAFSGYSCNILFVDEPFHGLDTGGKAAAYEFFKTEAQQELVLVTDNTFDAKGSIDARIWTVCKKGKISHLEN